MYLATCKVCNKQRTGQTEDELNLGGMTIDLKANESESNMLLRHFLKVGPTWWTHLCKCVQHVGPTFRKCNDIVIASLIASDCVAFESSFHS